MRHDYVHPVFQGILNMMMPAPVNTNCQVPVRSEEEERAILEHHREEYRSGLDSVDDEGNED
jgi:hypothetical protein